MTKLTPLTPPMSLEEEGGPGRRRIHLREITGDGELPLETVGQDLRAARLRRGDDLATVSKALKIRKDHLEALEEDRIDNLPGKTYAIGFVRTYAQYLGLDPSAFVERFKQEISGRAEEQAQPAAIIHDEEQRRLPQGWRLMGGVLIILLGYGAWHLFASDRESAQVVPPPPVVNPPKPVQAATPPPQQPQQQAVTSPAIDASGNVAGGATPSPAATGAPGTNSQPQAQPSPAAANPAAPAANQAATPSPAVAAVGHAYGEQYRDARVVLRVRAATHVTVRNREGTVFINRNLSPGDTYNVPNLVGLTLSATDGGAVEVDLDGLAMGSAGAQAQPSDNLQLDPQSIVDHFNNRRPG